MKYCPTCGTQVVDEANFCMKCGFSFNGQNAINRDLLRVHIEQLKAQISGFKNPYKNNRSVYANVAQHAVATMIQVEV